MANLLTYNTLFFFFSFLVAGRPPKHAYFPHVDDWGTSGHQGDKLALKTWWEYGCSRQDAEIGQFELKPGWCKNFRSKFHSMLFDMPIRPDRPSKNDKTIWNCTLSVYEGEECNGNKLVTYTDQNKSVPEAANCLPAYNSYDADRVGHSIMVDCNGKTGYELAIVKPFCEDPRLNPDGHKGILGKGPYLNFKSRGDKPMKDDGSYKDVRNPYMELDTQCKVEPFLELEYNTTEYWNAKKHHDADPYWFLKVHELGHLTGCDMWTNIIKYGLCGTPGTLTGYCELSRPQWPERLPWKKDQKGNWIQPLPNVENKYPSWPNDGYRACLSAYDENQAVVSRYTSWHGPPYYSTHYASTFDWGTATGEVSGTIRTRFYPYLKPTVSTIWDDTVETSSWPTSWPTDASTWRMPPTDGTASFSMAKNTHTRPSIKTRYSTITVAPPSRTTKIDLLPGSVVGTMENGETILRMSTYSQTYTIAGDKVIPGPAETSEAPLSWATYPEWSPTGEYRSLYPSFSEKWLPMSSAKKSLWEPTPAIITKYNTVTVAASG